MAKMMGPRFKMCRRLGLNVIGHPKAMERGFRGTSRADKIWYSIIRKTKIKSLLRCYGKTVC